MIKKLITLGLVSLLLLACVFANGSAESAGEKHTIALSVPLTGKMAQYGISYRNAAQLAIEDFNAKGGLNGEPVKLTVYDDAGDQSVAINVSDLIVEDKDVFAFVGSYGSSTSLVMAPIFQDAQIPMISPNTSHPDFFEIGNMMMPLSARSDNCFEEVADVIVEDYSPKSVVMIYQNNDSGVTIDDVFKYQFPKHGVTYASETFVGGETNDFTPIITSLVTKYNPDILIVCSDYSYGSQIVIQAKQLNVKAQLVGIQSMFKPQVASLTGEYGEDLVLCGVQRIYTPEVIENNDYGAYCEDIIARYTEKYPGVQFDSPAALAYDAVMLACDAAAHVGTNNPVALVEYMKELNIDLCSGDAWFDENGDFFRSVYKYVIKNGEFVVID